ncbi:MAG TPA: hypothetical protein VF054_06730 [Micromonosporaceae bacterium]
MSGMDINGATPVSANPGERALLVFVGALVILGVMAMLAVLG